MYIETLRRAAAAIPPDIEFKEGTPDALEIEIKKIKTDIISAISAKADIETVKAMQIQLDALDVKLAERHSTGIADESLEDVLKKDTGLERFMADKSGTYAFQLDAKQSRKLMERKTTVDSAAVGITTSGVLTIDRTPGIVPEARQQLTIRDVLASRPTTMQVIDFVKVNSAPSRASMQTESSAKTENAVTFNTGTARVQTISTWIPASRQVLDDLPELMGYLQTALPYYVNLTEEVQMLTGSNTGQDLNGLITQGTAFNTALLSASAGWQKADQLARAIQQISVAKEIQPTFVVLHPNDFWDIQLTKDSQKRYLGFGADAPNLFWGLTPVVTVNIGSGTFLVGSGNPAAVEIRDRMGMTVEISTQHQDYFIKNLIAIRVEKRVALVCYRPGSFVIGSFSTSP